MFSTGQVSEGAVNYVSSAAVCGLPVTAQNPAIPANQTNLTLPQIQSCPSPIGAKWVAAVTNWLCFAIDGAGLSYAAGTVCQNPNLLFLAIQSIINAYTIHLVFAEAALVGSTGVVDPPSPSINQGQVGQNFLDRLTENLWGPKTSGGWPTSPAVFGNNRVVGLTSAGVNTFTKVNCFVQFNNNSSMITAKIMDPTDDRMANYYYLFHNTSSIAHLINTPVGVIQGGPNILSPTANLAIAPGQILLLTCDNVNWNVTCDSQNFAGMANVATLKSSPSGSDIICFFDAGDGSLKKCTITELLAA